jgi:hypothetical protein
MGSYQVFSEHSGCSIHFESVGAEETEQLGVGSSSSISSKASLQSLQRLGGSGKKKKLNLLLVGSKVPDKSFGCLLDNLNRAKARHPRLSLVHGIGSENMDRSKRKVGRESLPWIGNNNFKAEIPTILGGSNKTHFTADNVKLLESAVELKVTRD